MKKEMEAKRKREQLREMLRKAEIEQLEMKKRQREEEDYLEKQFRIKMLERLAEQDRTDQLTMERRRQKVL